MKLNLKMQKVYICTPEAPWEAKHGLPAQHPDAELQYIEDGYPGGDIEHYRCPVCGKLFAIEIAQ